MTERYGATVGTSTTRFVVRSPEAAALWLCLFEGEGERRVAMRRDGDDWIVELPGDLRGSRYGYRAGGEWAPERGRWFDSSKLLVDPHAVELDGPFVQDPRLAIRGVETAGLAPKAIVSPPAQNFTREPPRFTRGGLIYEVNVRGLTMLHPDIPETLRGTVGAIAHPAILRHLKKLHANAIELMPIIAWIDERHLPALGLRNAWGYNPVTPMALDPRLCPGGVAELRDTVATLHAEGIGVILDIVLNHTGESDALGPILSLRGLDDCAYAHDPSGQLINDSGCGNTLDFARPFVRQLALAALRHFVTQCGIDGFRFDLAPILARGPGFDPHAPIFAEIAADPVLADRLVIAEPWDVGPGGYQLGGFPPNWIEWNDRFRDDVRRFWRGDAGVGVLASRLAGSADLFGLPCRSVNFLAAHDGFTLADTVAYAERHNLANGEGNRDGHGSEPSWNNGVEGPSDDEDVIAARARDLRALLGTLFASTGSIMLTAGDEFGRTQGGNNNAYAQDNRLAWLDWEGRNLDLEEHVAALAAWRAARTPSFADFPRTGEWLRLDGETMSIADWQSPTTTGFRYRSSDAARSYDLAIDRGGIVRAMWQPA